MPRLIHRVELYEIVLHTKVKRGVRVHGKLSMSATVFLNVVDVGSPLYWVAGSGYTTLSGVLNA